MNTSKNIMEKDLKPNQANYFPLSPISFLTRTANIWPDRIAWIHGKKKNTYKQLLEKCTLIASGLSRKGISKGEIGLYKKQSYDEYIVNVSLERENILY